MAKIIQKITSGSLQLSPNFYLSEFLISDNAVRAGISNTPDPLSVQNLFRLAKMMEQVRALLGNRVIVVSSGFRSPAVNALAGSSSTSEHLHGDACDFVCNGFGTPRQVAAAIAKSGIKFGQLIQEFGGWVHISTPGKFNQSVMTASIVNGKAVYSNGLV